MIPADQASRNLPFPSRHPEQARAAARRPARSGDKNQRGWYNRWKKTPANQRQAAGVSLQDLFACERSSRVWVWLLLASAVLHVLTVPFLLRGGTTKQQAEAGKSAYMRQVMSKERARFAAKDMEHRLTVPPKPPDPEKFVAKAMTESLVADLKQVTAGVLRNVKLENQMVQRVATSLEQEIKAASARIASGKMTKAEMQEMQRKFKNKVIATAQEWRNDYKDNKQVDIATVTVSGWYEAKVATQFKGIIREKLGTLWREYLGWYHHGNHPGFLRQDRHIEFARLGDRLAALLGGSCHENEVPRVPDSEEIVAKFKHVQNSYVLPGWPPSLPGVDQARTLDLFAKSFFGQWSALCRPYVKAYYPHRAEEMEKYLQDMEALWKKTLQEIDTYVKKSSGGVGTAELTPIRDACLADLKALNDKQGKLVIPDQATSDKYDTINLALRTRVLKSAFPEELYRQMSDTLVNRVKPSMENLAENQFREGMRLSEEGVANAMKEFRQMSVSLLRRDIEDAISKPAFLNNIWFSGRNPYKSDITKEPRPPTDAECRNEEKALAEVLAKWPAADKAFPEKRTEAIKEELRDAVNRFIADKLLPGLTTPDGRMTRDFYVKAETADYADPFQEKLEARDMAWKGRKQDLGDLTKEGVPNTDNPLIALAAGMSQGQVALQPVLAPGMPAFFPDKALQAREVLRWSAATAPPPAAPWGFVTQAEVKPAFDTPNFEAIPFLPNFPNIDGDLTDWCGVRPLQLRLDPESDPQLKGPPILLYAAWNYQGFFFGYEVKLPRHLFNPPSQYSVGADGVTWVKNQGGGLGLGDAMKLCFDTLDARMPIRGDPHSQEFCILPGGTMNDPNVPGLERVIASRRDGAMEGGQVKKATIRMFPQQPPLERGPDGTGPYRVMKFTDDGYVVEAFIPRSVFKVPVFAPGWYIGFDCFVVTGYQTWAKPVGRGWVQSSPDGRSYGNQPAGWGDLLLLGTDARFIIQDADPAWPKSQAIIPGRSYLVTIMDPDRNVNLAAEDTVLVSAEAAWPGEAKARDVDIFLIKETGKNTGIFQGYIDTQPGRGGEVQGMLELTPGEEVRFGYVDFADSHGRRNVVYEQKLPVVADVFETAHAKK